MIGCDIVKSVLIGLTVVLVTVHGKCPFAGDSGHGAADEAALSVNEADLEGYSYHGPGFPSTHKLYTKEYSLKSTSPDPEEKIRVKRNLRIPEDAVRSAVEVGWKETQKSKQIFDDLQKQGGPVKMRSDDAAYGHFVNFRAHDTSISLNSISSAMLRATKYLQNEYSKRFGMTPYNFIAFLRHHGYTIPELAGSCQRDPVCTKKDLHYRTINGACNNPWHSSWGMSRTALVRLVTPKYYDAVYEPSKSVTGYPLPSTSVISFVLLPDIFHQDHVWTRSTMVWGQFMAHDLSLSPSTQAKGAPIQCCGTNGTHHLPDNQLHPACLPIDVPSDHPFYSKFGVRCLNFVRSMTVPSDGCKLGEGQQMNVVSHYLDLSPVYGSTLEVANSLRTFRGGELKAIFSKAARGEMPPDADDKSGSCNIHSPSEPCYKTGDVRVNLHLDLTVVQVMMLRWHNYIARRFQGLNPHWDDEKIYQEARKYCIAAYQHICYEEWLPIILGKDYMINHGLLRPDKDYNGFVRDYNPKIPATVINSFTTSAFRFLHSTAQGFVELISPSRKIYGSIPLSDNFNKPAPMVEENFFNGLLTGLVTQPMQTLDAYFTRQLNGYLFKGDKPFGLDLESIDLQRHRDHGLGGYNDYRYICGLPKAKKWEDFLDVMTPQKLERLRSLYLKPDDVDLLAGCALETPVKGSLLGATSLCIIGEQFYRTRVGDRFFFENGEVGSLPPAQLAEIRKYTWSKLICETTDGLDEIQPEGFKQLSHSNHLINCHSFPEINYHAWKD